MGFWDITNTSPANYPWEEIQQYCSDYPANCISEDTNIGIPDAGGYPILLDTLNCDIQTEDGWKLNDDPRLTYKNQGGNIVTHNIIEGSYILITYDEALALSQDFVEGDISLEIPIIPISPGGSSYINITLRVELELNHPETGWYNFGVVYEESFFTTPGQQEVVSNIDNTQYNDPFDWLSQAHDGEDAEYRFIISVRPYDTPPDEYLLLNENINFSVLLTDCVPALGDINNDGLWDVLDIVTLANCVLTDRCHDPQHTPYGCAGDMQGDGYWNILDIVILLNCVLAANCDG